MADGLLNHEFIQGDDINQTWENTIAKHNELKKKGENLDVLDIRIINPADGLDFPEKGPSGGVNFEMCSKELLATHTIGNIDWRQRLIDPYTEINGEKISLNMPNPLDEIVKKYEHGFEQNQATLQISMPSDNGIGRNRPNLALIDTRVRYGKLHLFAHMTSLDLFHELPSNMAGMSQIQKYLAEKLSVERGELYFTSPNVSLTEKIDAKYIEPTAESKMRPFKADVFDLDDLWFTMLFNCLEIGYKYPVEHGSFAKVDTRLEFDFATFRIKKPGNRPLTPSIPEGWTGFIPPTTVDKIEKYFNEYLIDPILKKNEDYTYARRMHDPHIPIKFKDKKDRIENIPWILKEIPTGVNQYTDAFERFSQGETYSILEIGRANDLELQSPPCARIQHLFVRDGKLHSMLYFRSWDLYAGLPENLGGFQRMKEDMAEALGLEDGEMFASSKGLHIYGNTEELAKMRTYKSKFEPKE